MNMRKSWLRIVTTAVAISVVLSMSAMAAMSAPEPGVGLEPLGPMGNDDGTLDVGAEYPSADAPGTADDRPIHKDSAWNFYNKMRDAGYTGVNDFIWGNSNAWETDYKRAALGGQEESWIDNVDIFFVHSHGNYDNGTGVGSIWIPYGHTDTDVVPNDCAWSWGTKDVEWIGVKTCLSLRDDDGWATCMNGVHLIAGFTTLSASNEFGGHWADEMLGWQWLGMWIRPPKTVTQAWFSACDTQTNGATARVIAEHPNHYSDKVWNRGGPAYGDVVDNWYHVWDKACYKVPPRAVDVSVLATVPTQRVMDRTVDEGFAASLAQTLGVQGTLSLSPDGSEYAITSTANGMTRTLTIETATGGYEYQNLSQLWVPPQGPLNLPPPGEAATLATAYFLANASALPGGPNIDTSSSHAETEGFSSAGRPGTMAAAADPPPATNVDVMVAYGRTLPMIARSPSGDAVMANVSVAGPGSSTKMYLGTGNAPIGLSGGSRDVETDPSKPVDLKPVEATWDAFVEDPELATMPVGIAYTSMVQNTTDPKYPTFAYYEQPLDVGQDELIPTWVYNVNFMQGAEVAGNGLVYVPASPSYYPPSFTIDSPLKNTSIVAGRPVELKATVASGNGPYKYVWSSSSQGILGTAEDITVSLRNTSKLGDPPAPVTLSLMITDANGLSRTEEVEVLVLGQPLWLPTIGR